MPLRPHPPVFKKLKNGEHYRQSISTEPSGKDWTDRWRRITDGAQQILAPSPEAEAFAASILPQRTIELIGRATKKRSRATRKPKKAAVRHLGLVPAQCSAREQWLMSEIARQLNKMRPTISITIIGTTLDDISLMRSRNTFVTGAVNAEEFEREVEFTRSWTSLRHCNTAAIRTSDPVRRSFFVASNGLLRLVERPYKAREKRFPD